MPFRQRNKLNNGPYTDINVNQTAINELANKPRRDIDGQRYGNTLSDDMFAIKNPSLPDRHTPESYEYFGQPHVDAAPTGMAPAAAWNPLPTLNEDLSLKESLANRYPVFRDNDLVSRQKEVTGDSLPWEVYKDWGLLDDILEFPEYYTDAQLEWADGLRKQREARQRVNDLSTEGMMEEKFGDIPSTQSPRMDAEYDPYLGTDVNYGAMSPRTMEMLAKMGVNRPMVEDEESLRLDENASDTYNSLLNLYRLALQNGWR